MGARNQEVLAIVEHQQSVGSRQHANHSVELPLVSVVAHADRCREREWHEPRIVDRREIDEPDAVGKSRSTHGGDLQRQTCLPGSTRSMNGDESILDDHPLNFGQVALAAYEARARLWQPNVSRALLLCLWFRLCVWLRRSPGFVGCTQAGIGQQVSKKLGTDR